MKTCARCRKSPPQVRFKKGRFCTGCVRKNYLETPAGKQSKHWGAVIQRWKKHGVMNFTRRDFDQMLMEQNGLCAICMMQMVEPNLDHDHKTGKARGLLCMKCNRGLGCFRDDPGALLAASKYLSR